jgi:hypothetical protein
MKAESTNEHEVAREIADLSDLNRENLIARWCAIYGVPPPRKLSRALLEKALAYEIQCATFGGLSGTAKRALQEAVKTKGRATGTRLLNPGARLVREWNGVVHEVDVAGDDFVWQGETYRSLTAIACRITGTKWSGPRFFGLERQR